MHRKDMPYNSHARLLYQLLQQYRFNAIKKTNNATNYKKDVFITKC